MGRMIDILRTADHRPVADDAAPVHLAPAENGARESAVRSQMSEEGSATLAAEARGVVAKAPILEDHDDVPFIEVGGPREPTLRLVTAPKSEPVEMKPLPSPVPPASNYPAGEGPRFPPSPGRPASGYPAGEGPGVRVLGYSKDQQPPSPPAPLPQSRERGECNPAALFTIRFEPVHAARLFGRGPVAELVAFHQPDHTISNQYRALAAEIDRQLPGATPRVLLFAAGAESIGASTVILNLAMTLARKEARVTVVDAHLARPALAARLGLAGGPGLREVLAGQTPAAWCLQETAHPNLFAMSAGGKGERRDGFDLSGVVDLLRGRSDYVLFDAGPWNEATIVCELATRSDAVYLVLDHDAATTAITSQLQQEILTQTGRLRGCVLTQR